MKEKPLMMFERAHIGTLDLIVDSQGMRAMFHMRDGKLKQAYRFFILDLGKIR